LFKAAKIASTGGLHTPDSGRAPRELYTKSNKVQPNLERYTASRLQAVESLRIVDEGNEDQADDGEVDTVALG
jgi:hypothetical protein